MRIRSAWTRIVAVACYLSASICLAQDKAPVQFNDQKDLEAFVVSSDDKAIVVASENAEAFKYWIGLLCVDLSDALRAQLDLESGVGLLVDAVTEDGPAKKQGIQRHDILISARLADESPEKPAKKLSQVTDLVELVRAAETKPLQFEIVRRGQRKMIEVAPVDRPKQDRRWLGLGLNELKEDDAVRRRHSVGSGLRIFLAGPMIESASTTPPTSVAPAVPPVPVGIQAVPAGPPVVTNVLPRVTSSKPVMKQVDVTTSVARVVVSPTTDLPDNVTVSIVRKGSDPAKITVKKDEHSWEITEKELDKLPIDIRKLLEPLIPSPKRMTARVQYSPYTYKKYVIEKESNADGKSPTKPTSPEPKSPHEPSPVDPMPAKTQRQRTESNPQSFDDRDIATKSQARQADIERREKELNDKLKDLNDKIDRLQQSLEKRAQ